VIEPILRALGYEDLEFRKRVQGIGGDYPDYLVLPGSDHQWVLEAKEWDARLDERCERQAVNYANNNGAQWAVLTNGKTWRVYNTRAGGDLSQQRVYELADISEVDGGAEVLSRLSRDLMMCGQLNKEYRSRKIRAALKEALLDSDPKIVEAMRSVIGRMLDMHVSCEDIKDVLTAFVRADTSLAPLVPAPEEGKPVVVADRRFCTLADLVKNSDYCTGKRPTRVRGLGAEAVDASTWRDVAVFVVEHSPASALDRLPFAAGPSAKRYFLNLEPKHRDGRQMRQPRVISWAGARVYAELADYSAKELVALLGRWLRSIGADPEAVEVEIQPERPQS